MGDGLVQMWPWRVPLTRPTASAEGVVRWRPHRLLLLCVCCSGTLFPLRALRRRTPDAVLCLRVAILVRCLCVHC